LRVGLLLSKKAEERDTILRLFTTAPTDPRLKAPREEAGLRQRVRGTLRSHRRSRSGKKHQEKRLCPNAEEERG